MSWYLLGQVGTPGGRGAQEEEDPRRKGTPGEGRPQKEGHFLAQGFSPPEGAILQMVDGHWYPHHLFQQDAGRASTVGLCLVSNQLLSNHLGSLSTTSQIPAAPGGGGPFH